MDSVKNILFRLENELDTYLKTGKSGLDDIFKDLVQILFSMNEQDRERLIILSQEAFYKKKDHDIFEDETPIPNPGISFEPDTDDIKFEREMRSYYDHLYQHTVSFYRQLQKNAGLFGITVQNDELEYRVIIRGYRYLLGVAYIRVDVPDGIERDYRLYLLFKEKVREFFSDKDTTLPQRLTIPDTVLQALEKTTNKIGNNAVRKMIENAADRPLKWLVTKQDLRELLTHDKIKGTFSIAEIERQTPDLFIDKDGNPMKLAKNKANNSFETDFIKQILATL